jgi:hypothetical protein
LVGQALLVHRDLQDTPKGSVVAVDRRRCEAGGDLVVEPVLDLVGRESSEPVGAEPRKDVPPQVPCVGLLGRGRQPAGEREELLGPRSERGVGAGGVDPPASLEVDLHLAEEPLRVRLAGERLGPLPSERVPVARPVAAVALLDESHLNLLIDSLEACGERTGSKTRGSGGDQR